MHQRVSWVAVVFLGFINCVARGSFTLYDGTKTGLPDTQGSLAYQTGLGTGKETLATGNVGPVTLDTTAGGSNQESAGLSNYKVTGSPGNYNYSMVNGAFPILSPTNGFDLTFSAKLDSESHANNDRAGFDVILLGNDLSGIELGFWANQVWAQATNANPSLDFTHGEGNAAFSPASGFHSYDLHIQGSAYSLSADGSLILNGQTRNYSAYPLSPLFPDPYTIPDFVFLGDDTNAAQGITEINSIGVVVPEPASVTLLIAASALTLLRRREVI